METGYSELRTLNSALFLVVTMTRERNIRLLIAYEGTRYQGWQRQKESPTIQGTIEDTLTRLTQQKISLMGAGRTDSGVHAWGQVANFRTHSDLPSAKMESALNALLPQDILIRQVQEVLPDFHARYSCQSKVYDYYICPHPGKMPFFRHYCWQVGAPIDLALVKTGLSLLVGEHDFSSFRSQGSETAHPVRIVYQASLSPLGWSGYRVRFRANGFLRHMVRNMVGILVRIGLKRISLAELEEVIHSHDRSRAGEMAPPQGLFLRKVFYPAF